MKRTLLIDADIVAFKFASAHEEVYYFDGKDKPPATSSDFGAACDAARDYIAMLADKLAASDVVVCLTDPVESFRKNLWPGYKAGRTARRPEHLQAVKDWFKTVYQTYERPGLEADDCMGILSTHPTLIKGEKVIVSEDKDMQTIPGLLCNPRVDIDSRKNLVVRKIGKLKADRFHLWQTIVGDATDGYPGAPGIGPKSEFAEAVLAAKSVEEGWRHVMAAYEKAAAKGKLGDETPADAALRNSRMARILRAGDWDFKQKRPKLWMPPALWAVGT